MPFAVKDALRYKRNDRQTREIHEEQYLKYLANLRQQQQRQQTNSRYANQYYLSSNHSNELERSRVRTALGKQSDHERIQRENFALYDRLLKAGQRATVDDRNHSYEQNLEAFHFKRYQQRANEYKRINSDNQVLLRRLNNVRAELLDKEQCENDWKKHVNVMKKTCDYPENIDRFVSATTRNEQKQVYQRSKLRNTQWNHRHFLSHSPTRYTITPLTVLLEE